MLTEWFSILYDSHIYLHVYQRDDKTMQNI